MSENNICTYTAHLHILKAAEILNVPLFNKPLFPFAVCNLKHTGKKQSPICIYIKKYIYI